MSRHGACQDYSFWGLTPDRNPWDPMGPSRLHAPAVSEELRRLPSSRFLGTCRRQCGSTDLDGRMAMASMASMASVFRGSFTHGFGSKPWWGTLSRSWLMDGWSRKNMVINGDNGFWPITQLKHHPFTTGSCQHLPTVPPPVLPVIFTA